MSVEGGAELLAVLLDGLDRCQEDLLVFRFKQFLEEYCMRRAHLRNYRIVQDLLIRLEEGRALRHRVLRRLPIRN